MGLTWFVCGWRASRDGRGFEQVGLSCEDDGGGSAGRWEARHVTRGLRACLFFGLVSVTYFTARLMGMIAIERRSYLDVSVVMRCVARLQMWCRLIRVAYTPLRTSCVSRRTPRADMYIDHISLISAAQSQDHLVPRQPPLLNGPKGASSPRGRRRRIAFGRRAGLPSVSEWHSRRRLCIRRTTWMRPSLSP